MMTAMQRDVMGNGEGGADGGVYGGGFCTSKTNSVQKENKDTL